MAFTGTFTSASSNSALNARTFTDTSSYNSEGKNTFSDRRIYAFRVDGSLVLPGAQEVATAGAKPTNQLTVLSVPPNGYNITIHTSAAMGSELLVDYTKNSSDTTTGLLAQHITDTLNIYYPTVSFVVTYSGSVITFEYQTETGAYNGEVLVLTFYGSGIIPTSQTGFTGGAVSSTVIVTGLDYWYFDFTAYPDDTITISPLLAEDAALNILMVWVSTDPQEDSTYTALLVIGLTDYTSQFLYGLTQRISAKRNLENDSIFMAYRYVLRVMVNTCNKAVYWQDQYAAQRALDNAANIISKQSIYF